MKFIPVSLFLASLLNTLHAEVRTFTSSAGTSIRGEFISLADGKVTIKKEDGSSITVPLTAFSRVDQTWLSSQKPTSSAADPAKATKEAPFENSLGMKFVPVPGTSVLFCTHIVRRVDYAAYDAAVRNVDASWKTHPKDGNGSPINQGNDYPVVGVNWEDSKNFCDWLSTAEGRVYRLPTDREWSYAVGIGELEKDKAGATPKSLSEKIKNVYPWGTEWPPPKGAGNFADVSLQATSPTKDPNCFRDYDDGFPSTSPVFAFKPNRLGIHDLAGNIGQWCMDWFDTAQKGRVQRGGDYLKGVNNRGWMLSSFRIGQPPDARLYYDIGFSGFRVVLQLPKP